MSWSRRWTGCADGGSAAPGAWSAPSLPCDEWACHFLCSCKESNQRNTPPSASRRCAPVPCAPRSAEGRRGTRCAQTPAPLHPRRTCGARLATRRTRQPQRRPISARSLCRVERRSTRARSAGFAFLFFHRVAGTHRKMTGHGRGGGGGGWGGGGGRGGRGGVVRAAARAPRGRPAGAGPPPRGGGGGRPPPPPPPPAPRPPPPPPPPPARDLSMLRDLPAARGLSPLAANPSPLEQHQADRQRAHACHQPVNRLVALGIALGRRQQFIQRQEHHHAGDQPEHPAEGGVRQ